MWDVSLIIGMALPYIILSYILAFTDVRVDGATLQEKLKVKVAEHHKAIKIINVPFYRFYFKIKLEHNLNMRCTNDG